MGRSAKSWARKATTLRWATKRASSSRPAGVRLLSWMPLTSEPIVGVRWLTWVPVGSRFGKLGSASLPCSLCSKGSRGGYFCSGFHVGR